MKKITKKRGRPSNAELALKSKARVDTGSKTLLEKAIEKKTTAPITHRIGNEHYELALAWMTGMVTNAQVASALELVFVDDVGNVRTDSHSAVYRMAVYLREAFLRGKINVNKNK